VGLRSSTKQLWVENVGRFFAAESTGAGHEHNAAYMVGGFLTGFAPWSFFLVPLAIYPLLGAAAAGSRRLPLPARLVHRGLRVLLDLPEQADGVPAADLSAAALLLGSWWSRIAADPLGLPPQLARALRIVSVALAVGLVALVALLLSVGLGADPLSWVGRFLHPKIRRTCRCSRRCCARAS